MLTQAGVAELVDALDLGSSGATCGGSSPSTRTLASVFKIFNGSAAPATGRNL